MAWTNRGAYLEAQYVFRAVAIPTNFYVILLTSATPPTVDTNVVSELTQIATGNGYVAGGYQLTPGVTDFDSNTQNNTDNRAEIQIKDVSWTASGGNIPASGNGARYAALTTNEAVVADRQVMKYWDLVLDRTVSDTQILLLQNLEFRGTTA